MRPAASPLKGWAQRLASAFSQNRKGGSQPFCRPAVCPGVTCRALIPGTRKIGRRQPDASNVVRLSELLAERRRGYDMGVWRRVGSVGVLPLVLVMWGCSGEDSPSVPSLPPLATITSGSTLPVTSTSSSTGAAPTLSATTTAPGPTPPSTSVTDPPRSATTVIPTTTTTTLAAPPGFAVPDCAGVDHRGR